MHQHKYSSTALEPTTTLDYNAYNAPSISQDVYHFFANYTGNGWSKYTLAELQAATSFETNSTITDYPVDSVRVFKNFSTSSHVFDLGSGIYKRRDGATVSGSVTVAAMYSTILYNINANETGRDPLDYMDTDIVPFYAPAEEPPPTPKVGLDLHISGSQINTYIGGSEIDKYGF